MAHWNHRRALHRAPNLHKVSYSFLDEVITLLFVFLISALRKKKNQTAKKLQFVCFHHIFILMHIQARVDPSHMHGAGSKSGPLPQLNASRCGNAQNSFFSLSIKLWDTLRHASFCRVFSSLLVGCVCFFNETYKRTGKCVELAFIILFFVFPPLIIGSREIAK